MQVLAEGQFVKHAQYGLGVVTQSDAERTSIDFHLHGIKKFVTRLMTVELTDEAPPPKPQPARRKKLINPDFSVHDSRHWEVSEVGRRPTGTRGCARPGGSILRRRLGGFGRACYQGFVARGVGAIGEKLFLPTAGKFSLGAAFGLLALLFQSLHFLPTLLGGSGHQVSLESECTLTISPTHRLGLPAGLTRLACGFAVVLI